MIQQAVKHILDTLNTHLGDIDLEQDGTQRMTLGNIAMVDAFNDASAQDLSNSIVLSVINIEEEKTLKNGSRVPLPGPNDNTVLLLPPTINLNIYLLFSSNMNNYERGLLHLSRIIGFFQMQPSFFVAVDGGGQVKLILDIYSLNFEQLNQVWGIMGGKYIPSVLYKMRLVTIQAATGTPTSVIKRIQREENVL